MNIWEWTVSMKIFISYINKKSQSADKMGWPVDINSFQYCCPLNWHAWNINRVPEWQRWRLSMTSPAWTSTSKANLITPTSEHPTSLTHWDFVFPIPASLCSAVFWYSNRVHSYQGTQQNYIELWLTVTLRALLCPGKDKQEEESLSQQGLLTLIDRRS